MATFRVVIERIIEEVRLVDSDDIDGAETLARLGIGELESEADVTEMIIYTEEV